MSHKIIVKNAVKRKPGYLYSIDGQGNLVETIGPGVFNIKKSASSTAPTQVRTQGTKSPRIKNNSNMSADMDSTLRKKQHLLEEDSTLRNPNLGRMSKLQKEILLLLKTNGPMTIQNVWNKLPYHFQSIYRSVENLSRKNLILKKRKYDWYGPWTIETKK